jgi:hypothetical protein
MIGSFLLLVIGPFIGVPLAFAEMRNFSKHPTLVQITPSNSFEKWTKHNQLHIESKCKEEMEVAKKWRVEVNPFYDDEELQTKNPQRFSALKKKSAEASEKETRCLSDAEKKNPLDLVLDLYSSADLNSKRIGRLILRVRSSWFPEGFKFVQEGGSTFEFTPAIDESRYWGGQRYQTALAANGNWVKLPKNPFPTPVWARFGKDSDFGEAKLVEIQKLAPVNLRTEAFTGPAKIESIKNGMALVTTVDPKPPCECGSGANDDSDDSDSEPPKVPEPEGLHPDHKEFVQKKISIPISELFDANGAIRASTAQIEECDCGC